ncbi:MAG: phosphate/phosphite/phosphonate ABC transporter substrate-binding protein, partial [candidate division Zixibacteria bacterium]|nr:phosphate/phosphite/phosphonate ABC transporter substrate-binding protein [candidate division Zixibacteria bacterium]
MPSSLFANQMRNRIIVAVLLVIFYGCSAEPEATYVNFSQRMTVERPGDQIKDSSHFRVAVGSMISARETVVHYHQLLDYIAGKLGREVQLVQRKTYGEINELIGLGQIDLAFICSGPYAIGKEKYSLEAMAIPQVRGSYLYQSYLIVNKNSPFQKLDDLKGRTFAFTDPESNTGKLVPKYWLRQKGETPETFFRKTIYTYSHDNSIMAVGKALVDGAAVHGQIWEYYNHRNPVFTSKTRIIKKSEPFGNPPVVAPARMPNQMKDRIRQ